jgi:hypothetical protein
MLNNEHSPGAALPSETPEPDGTSPEDGRADERIPFLGHPFPIRAGEIRGSIRMRDLSCGGASGLCDEAFDVGAFVIVGLAKGHEVEAEVRWVRQMKVGLKFTDPLLPAFVRKLHQRHGTFATPRMGK